MFNPLIYRCLAYWTIVVILRCHSWSQPPNVIESESISICSKQHAFHNWWPLMVVLFAETKRLLDAMMQVSTLPAATKMYLSGKNREAVWFSICIHLPLCSYWLHRSTGEHIIIHGWKNQRGQSSVIIQLDCQSPSSGNKSFLVDANDCLDSRLRHIQWYTRHRSSLKHVLRWVKNWDTTQFPWIHHDFPYDQLGNLRILRYPMSTVSPMVSKPLQVSWLNRHHRAPIWRRWQQIKAMATFLNFFLLLPRVLMGKKWGLS